MNEVQVQVQYSVLAKYTDNVTSTLVILVLHVYTTPCIRCGIDLYIKTN